MRRNDNGLPDDSIKIKNREGAESMYDPSRPMDVFIKALEERAKELNCLYKIEELLNKPNRTLDDIFYGIVKALPAGMQYPEYCAARIQVENLEYKTRGFFETQWVLSSVIKVQDENVGKIDIFYTDKMPQADLGPFLKEERKLINTVADRISHFILHQRLKEVFEEWQTKKTELSEKPKPEWSVMLDLLRRTDQHLFSIISRKMINHLFCKGIDESRDLFRKLGTIDEEGSTNTEINMPSKKQVLENSYNLGVEIFKIAANYLTDEDILLHIQKWINEEKSHFLVKALANPNIALTEIADAIRRYYHINPTNSDKDSSVSKGIRVSLIRRFLTDQLDFLEIAKNYCEISDFYELLQSTIFPTESHGKLGGKSAGLFLAKKILEKSALDIDILAEVKTPKTWYITSDGLMNFIYYNNLEDVIEQKYKVLDEIRQEYYHLIQAFKNSHFSAEIMNGLSRALDDFGDRPIIVRSSSLLEDRTGSAFAGKYKSLFLANQGRKQERLEALMDAIAEVYASTFGPDPIGYRIERGLLDFNEEMGIMIQEVVGKKIGKYFLPAFAGVAFSNNEFRWSPRIKRDDGLIRMVPGLGTRAVDRIGDDYPVLIAPGQPQLRVNQTYEDVLGYSPKNIDVINLDTNTFETIPIDMLIKDIGVKYPLINDIFSIREERHLKKPIGLGIDTNKHDIIVTFENLISHTNYINQIKAMLNILKEKLGTPVDIEFACNGRNLYLLQCRPQSSSIDNVSAIIPKDVAKEQILFTANKYVSNGRVPDINYVVYVDPGNYLKHENLAELKAVAAAVGKLNQLLPKKNFILMGPGRWGSRGDIRLGVSVTYADINNTAVLIEMAGDDDSYVPDLSFGTHFFQDLVESSIRYLPLYPGEDTIFNEEFFINSPNCLTDYLPEYENISNTLRLINVSEVTGGMVLRILMNADDDEAIGMLTAPSTRAIYSPAGNVRPENAVIGIWQWRKNIADSIAANLDAKRFGIKKIFLFGNTVTDASKVSDIDLLVHFDGDEKQKHELNLWFEGWGLCLNEIYYEQTGIRVDKLLDVHIVTDYDIKNNSLYGDIIDKKKHAAIPLKVKGL